MSPVSNKPVGPAVAGPSSDPKTSQPQVDAAARQAERRAAQHAAQQAERKAAHQAAQQLARQKARPGAAAGSAPPEGPAKAVASPVAPRAPQPAGAAAPAPVASGPVSPPPAVPPPAVPAPAAPKPVPPLPANVQIAPPPPAEPATVRPPATLAKVRPRHRMLLLSFVLAVLLPIAATAVYLWKVADDQYASVVGFSVRREEIGSAMDLLGGITGISKSSSSDTDILYEFLQSQKLVADMEAKLNLRAIWSKPLNDPIFAFDPSGSIEDLVEYWAKMVRISYDSGSGLIEVRVLAFTAQDATNIAQALFDESTDMINNLSAIAREDAISYSRQELTTSQDRLRTAREAVTTFRTLNQLVDPSIDLQTHAGVLGALQSQLTVAQVEVDLLGESTQASDPRLLQAKRRIEVINARIAAERSKVGISTEGQTGEAYAKLVGEYERLSVEREFAERSYVAALASYDAATAEARRKSRYLAAHILPTTAEVARFPERLTLFSVISLFLVLAWAIGALVVYSVKDRR